jgi:hypothetical protein
VLWKEIPNFGIIYCNKLYVCGDKCFAQICAKVENLEGPAEELVAEGSPIRDCLLGLSFCFNQAMAVIYLLPLIYCVT